MSKPRDRTKRTSDKEFAHRRYLQLVGYGMGRDRAARYCAGYYKVTENDARHG